MSVSHSLPDLGSPAVAGSPPPAADRPPRIAPAVPDATERAPNALPGLTIVLPCFNEAANVADAVREARRAALRCADDYEIVVVDDGSSDDTAVLAAALVQADPQVRLLIDATNRGYGEALRFGITAARMPWVLITDGVHHRPRVAGRQSGASPRVVARAFRELSALRRSLRGLAITGARV